MPDMQFKQVQNDFMAHIRNPENCAFEGVEDRRLAIYRELFFNNIEGFVSSAFPVLKSLYCETDWLKLVRQFFVEHDCKSPYFLNISEEFLNYLSSGYQLTDADPAYMLELAHYEWVELALSIADRALDEKKLGDSDIQTCRLCFSSIAWRLSYAYPVQYAAEDNLDLEPMENGNHLVVYRDTDDDIQFVAINGLTAMMLQTIEQNKGIEFKTLLKQMAEAVPQFSEQQLAQGLMITLQDLSEREIIVTY